MQLSKRLIAFICLSGLAILLCQAAELPKSDPSSSQATSDPARAPSNAAQGSGSSAENEILGADEGDGDDQDGQYDGDDLDDYQDDDYYDEDDDEDEDEDEEEYEDEYEDDEEDDEMSLEQELSEISEEHFAVKRDCRQMAQDIAASQQSNLTVDSELRENYEGCQDYLKGIETQMRELTDKILQGDE